MKKKNESVKGKAKCQGGFVALYPFDTPEETVWNEKKKEWSREERRGENSLCYVTLSLKAETIVVVALPGH